MIAQRIMDFFNISAWILEFVCFEMRITEFIREQLSDRPALSRMWFWRLPRVTALECILKTSTFLHDIRRGFRINNFRQILLYDFV